MTRNAKFTTHNILKNLCSYSFNSRNTLYRLKLWLQSLKTRDEIRLDEVTLQ